MHDGSDPKNTEIYMMPGVGTNSTMTFATVPARVDYNTSNEVSSEYSFDQGLYYPAANGYAYYTGFEPPGEWGDQAGLLGLDAQNLQFSGLQAESLPYLYYSPGYGFAYSSPEQYNTYMSGSVIGVDGQFVGNPQYIPNPSYQPPGSPSGYFPIFIQPGTDFSSNISLEPLSFSSGTSVASRPASTSIKNRHQTSGNAAAPSQNAISGSPAIDASRPSHQNQNTSKPSDMAGVTVPKNDASSSSCGTFPVSASSAIKNGNSTEVTQVGWISSFQNLQVTSHGVNLGENYTPNNGNGNANVLFEQNRGPRTNRSKVPLMTSGGAEGGQTKAVSSNASRSIIIYPDQYNRDNFPVDYLEAKFFVIKSYSEDDVHKSIKYNVWSSTPNGNRRLDAAYSDAQGKSLGKPRNCPIFLFFSVNTSGQFCGVAEMVGPVDFHKDMDFWQQDKWSGSFPVKWHIIKDVPNSSFRHIILENNENKPVTNSRDTQEMPYKAGINMLKIFKNSLMTTSVLDDFAFYEGRQKMMLEEKCRRLGRSFDALLYVPAIVARNNVAAMCDQPREAAKGQLSSKDLPSGKAEQDYGAVVQTNKANKLKTDVAAAHIVKSDGRKPAGHAEQVKAEQDQLDSTTDQTVEKCSSDAPPRNDEIKPDGPNKLAKTNGRCEDDRKAQFEENSEKSKDSLGKKDLAPKVDGHAPLDGTEDGKAGLAGDAKSRRFIMKPTAFLNTSMEGEPTGSMVTGTTATGVVKVGSVHIKVNGAGETSSEILSVGIDPLKPKGAVHDEQHVSTKGNSVKSA